MNKFFITPLRKRVGTIWISTDQVQDWLKSWRFFFILGFGRSGTAFFADLLGRASGAYVFHEPVLEDFYAHLRAHYSRQAAENYICGFRLKEIYGRMQHTPPGTYGEVTATLRCHAAVLSKAIPGVTLLHLVRDGRDVVRSTVPRRTMTIRNPFSLGLHPVPPDPWYERWPDMDRFSRICWLWQEENARLRKAIGRTVQFERLISSYEYFESELLQPCGLSIDRATWQAGVGSPKNVTPKHQMPKWEGWTAEQQQAFRAICGEEMQACGYSM